MTNKPGPKAQPPQPPPTAVQLRATGITRERALLAERVGTLRFNKGWNRNELANASNLHVAIVQRIENGRSDPPLTTLLKLCRGLELAALEQLLGDFPSGDLI